MKYEYDKNQVLISITPEDVAFMLETRDERPTQDQFDALCEFIRTGGTAYYIYENMNEWMRGDWEWLKHEREW